MGDHFNVGDRPATLVVPGVTQPSDWGSLCWKAWRDGPRTTPFTFVCYGDSIAKGFYSSSFATKGWFGKLMVDLQALYGDGGSGYISTDETTGITAGSAGRITASGAGGTAVGGWDSYQFGINGYSLLPHVVNSGVTLTFTGVRGTSIDIYWIPQSTTDGFTYSIDGGGGVAVSTNPVTGTNGKTTITGLSAGNHTLVITASTRAPVISGVAGRNAAGVIGHNMSKGGRTSSAVSTAAASGYAATETEGKQSIQNFLPATNTCFLWALGTNDAATAFTNPSSQLDRAAAPATHTHTENTAIVYTQNATTGATAAPVSASAMVNGLETYVAWAAALAKIANSACETIFVMPHPGKGVFDSGGTMDGKLLLRQYAAPIYNVARTMGGAVVDHGTLGQSSWAYFNSLSYWGDATNDGLAGTDPVHYSDAGHAAVEAPLLTLLKSA